MRVGLFSPYLMTMGGGERYFLTTAEFFLKRGDSVDIFWRENYNPSNIFERFNVDISGVNFINDIFFVNGNFLKKIQKTAQYDLLYFLSDGSIPFSLAKKNILHFQVPFNGENRDTIINRLKLSRFNNVVCNSSFTKRYIDRTYGVNSNVVYPPVSVGDFSPGKKENIILSVGRFVNDFHPKKHEVMIREFVVLVKGGLKGWRLILMGGTSGEDERSVDNLRAKSRGYPITIVANCGFERLRDTYAKAKIYWHAAGFGEDLDKFPQKAEHFGMTTVEAMVAGCVPIVFAGGGQPEIVTEGKTGYLWQSTNELGLKTTDLIHNPRIRKRLSSQAIIQSKKFSKQHFFDEMEKLL